MASRLTFLMQVTTAPSNRADASPHTGGWSESFWARNPLVASDPDILILANKRAALLPKEASIVGFRIGNYTISGNRLLPAGSSTGRLQLPGSASRHTDVPQMALEMSGKGEAVSNSSRFAIKCIPDLQVDGGEYQPEASYKGLVTSYAKEITDKNWKFLGRDLAQPSLKVMSIANNVVTLNAASGAVAGTDFMRFRRVYDDNDDVIEGAFLVTAAAGNTVTLGGFANRTLTRPNGTMRIDRIIVVAYASVTPSRIVVRKVGRPFESYRGKASKKTRR